MERLPEQSFQPVDFEELFELHKNISSIIDTCLYDGGIVYPRKVGFRIAGEDGVSLVECGTYEGEEGPVADVTIGRIFIVTEDKYFQHNLHFRFNGFSASVVESYTEHERSGLISPTVTAPDFYKSDREEFESFFREQVLQHKVAHHPTRIETETLREILDKCSPATLVRSR